MGCRRRSCRKERQSLLVQRKYLAILLTMTVWGDDVDQETVQGYIEVARRMTEGETL